MMLLAELMLFIAILLALAVTAAVALRRLPVPHTVVLVVLGMALAGLASRWPVLAPVREVQLTPSIVLFVFLPALIFESALNLDARQLMKDLAPVLMLAIPALVVSALIVGVGLSLTSSVPLLLALLFGALISATDPVAVIALFKELGAPVRLTTLVEGESLFNDATAIVLFHILLGLLAAGTLTWSAAGGAVVEFVRVFLGGVAAGIVFGACASMALRRLGSNVLIFIGSLVAAYAGFIVAEHQLHVSGVMAVVSTALVIGILALTWMPQDARQFVRETWDVIAFVCNSLLFLLIGLSVPLRQLAEHAGFIAIAALLVLCARALMVYTLVPAATHLFSLPRITLGERHIMWWGGLKGGLAIAMVLAIPGELPGRQLLIELTLGVILISLLINAPTIRPLIQRLGIGRLTEEERLELSEAQRRLRAQADALLAECREARVLPITDELRVREATGRALTSALSDERPQPLSAQQAHLEGLRLEAEALERYREFGLLDHYAYLDYRHGLQRDREALLQRARLPQAGAPSKKSDNVFLRFEHALIRRMRERNWAARLLAWYQNLRLSQRIQHNVTAILTCSAVLGALPQLAMEDEARHALEDFYRARLRRRREQLQRLHAEFPDFCTRFEHRLFLLAALRRVRNHLEREHHHGQLGSKAYASIATGLDRVLATLPASDSPRQRIPPEQLMQRVPLFAGLPAATLEKLASRAQEVNFLSGDTIIGRQEKGSALYIVLNGEVDVCNPAHAASEKDVIATLGAGEFFGERGLLGDELRSADVKARTAVTLLRLSRRSVLDLARHDAAFDTHLRQVDAARQLS